MRSAIQKKLTGSTELGPCNVGSSTDSPFKRILTLKKK